MSGGLFSSSHTTSHSGFTAGVSNFVSAIFGVFTSLLQSVFAVFQAFFGLGANLIESAFAIVTHFLTMVTDVFSGFIGFVAGNFIAIAACIAAHFAWTTYQQRSGGRRPVVTNTRAKVH